MNKQFNPDKQQRIREETKGNDLLRKKMIEKIKMEDWEEEDDVVETKKNDAFFFQVVNDEETEEENNKIK
ncbi:MAG: hypothetical protein Q8Q33_06900 [Chlamydiota bacterium]|nr:hypothetical protein [Chlamydiota bacterium]